MVTTIGSLFAGIGGLEMGVEMATGGTTIWQAEIDPFARRVLKKLWPRAEQINDVRSINESTTTPTILCGGFPCQDISKAGKQKGISGDKSGLWSEYARIIGVLRPRFVFAENVATLSTNGLDRVLADLAALGLNAEWDTLGACCVGAPHQRERVFILACDPNRDRESARSVHAETSGLQGLAPNSDRDGVKTGRAARTVLGFTHNSGEVRRMEGRRSFKWEPEPGLCRVADGVRDRTHRLRCLGNAVVPQQAATAFAILSERLGRTV